VDGTHTHTHTQKQIALTIKRTSVGAGAERTVAIAPGVAPMWTGEPVVGWGGPDAKGDAHLYKNLSWEDPDR
jgi:hypothetical protein